MKMPLSSCKQIHLIFFFYSFILWDAIYSALPKYLRHKPPFSLFTSFYSSRLSIGRQLHDLWSTPIKKGAVWKQLRILSILWPNLSYEVLITHYLKEQNNTAENDTTTPVLTESYYSEVYRVCKHLSEVLGRKNRTSISLRYSGMWEVSSR